MTVGDAGERALIAQIAALSGPSTVACGIGDDCAVVTDTPVFRLYSTDNLVDRVHFDLSLCSGADIGFKALSRASSDIAAMGGAARYFLLNCLLPAETEIALFREIIAGIGEAASLLSVELIGGDVTSSAQLALGITVIGESALPPIRRCGAQPGDAVYVTGHPGDAAAGLRLLREGRDVPALSSAFRRPVARLSAGAALARLGVVTAMIDVSDGLAADAGQLAGASGVGCAVDDALIPLSDAMLRCFERHDALEMALSGGDDYELLFTAPAAADVPAMLGDLPVTRIGCIVSERGLWLEHGGRRTVLQPRGYEHYISS